MPGAKCIYLAQDGSGLIQRPGFWRAKVIFLLRAHRIPDLQPQSLVVSINANASLNIA